MSAPLRQRVTALLTLLLGVTLAGAILAPAALAAPVSTINPDTTGALHIHKFDQPVTEGPQADGLPHDTTGLSPIAGVQFTIQKVTGIDLTTNEGWQQAGAMTVEQAKAAAQTPGTTATTNTAGDADFTNLPLGLYLVTETQVPAGVTPGAPFLVTLPMTDPVHTDKWLYDVNVYPKNAVTGAQKTVHDSPSVVLGDDITYTITADIPHVQTIDGYKIVDPLDQRLDYKNAAVTLTDGTTITEGTDYTVVFDQASNTLTVQFTDAGRAVLAAHATTAKVQVVLTATANATGQIPNEAIVYPNAPSFDVKPGQPGGPITTPPVETRWGALVVEKVDQDNTNTKLAGATFQIYATQADAKAQTNPLTVGGKTDFVTGDDGRVVIDGLRYSDYANGAQLKPGDTDWRSYWIVETKAPDGYELLAQPIKADVTSSDTTTVTLTIKDVAHNGGFTLPQTGLGGTTGLITGGLLLLAGVTITGLIRRRRATQA